MEAMAVSISSLSSFSSSLSFYRHLQTSHGSNPQHAVSPPGAIKCSLHTNQTETPSPNPTRRVALLQSTLLLALTSSAAGDGIAAEQTQPQASRPKFYELDGSGGVKALDIREGSGGLPVTGDRVEIHYYGRLAAKQGWRFDSTYDHKDVFGNPEPYVFIVGDGSVIGGMDSAVRSMKEGGVRRVVIPPSQGYQNKQQGPIPPDYFDRQRLYTTIFNQTRLANGEGDTLGTLIFDIELLKVRRPE